MSKEESESEESMMRLNDENEDDSENSQDVVRIEESE